MPRKPKVKEEPQEWLVYMTCEVRKCVTVGPCTREQAEKDPFEHATDEQDIDMLDYEVTRVEENT